MTALSVLGKSGKTKRCHVLCTFKSNLLNELSREQRSLRTWYAAVSHQKHSGPSVLIQDILRLHSISVFKIPSGMYNLLNGRLKQTEVPSIQKKVKLIIAPKITWLLHRNVKLLLNVSKTQGHVRQQLLPCWDLARSSQIQFHYLSTFVVRWKKWTSRN